jgi:hypothetical protein
MTSYLEVRKSDAEHMIADIAQHWQARRKLGPALVICQDPSALQPQLALHWQQLTHHLQAKRNKTMASDELLRLTHQISEMQKTPITTNVGKQAGLYCTTPEELGATDVTSAYYSIYVVMPLNENQAGLLSAFLPNQSLITTYQQYAIGLQSLGLQPRTVLDQQLADQWQALQKFLQNYDIDIALLSAPTEKRAHYINEALDTLLATPAGQALLPLAAQFKATRQLAQPSHESPEQNRTYDTMMVLARHVQAWSITSFDQPFHTGIDDPMFFNDSERVLAEQFSVAYSEPDPQDASAQWRSAESFVAL